MESKTYTYQEPYFTMEVKAEGAFCVLIFFACAWLIYTNAYNMWGLYVVFAVAALYQVWNTFVARCYSHSVTLSDDQISFELFGKSQSYRLSELKEFRVREYPSSGKMYLRVGDHNALHGRFWLSTKTFTDGQELFGRLRDLEYEIHPDTLKARARRTNEEYVKTFGYGRHKQKAQNRSRVLKAVLTGKGDTLTRKSREK